MDILSYLSPAKSASVKHSILNGRPDLRSHLIANFRPALPAKQRAIRFANLRSKIVAAWERQDARCTEKEISGRLQRESHSNLPSSDWNVLMARCSDVPGTFAGGNTAARGLSSPRWSPSIRHRTTLSFSSLSLCNSPQTVTSWSSWYTRVALKWRRILGNSSRKSRSFYFKTWHLREETIATLVYRTSHQKIIGIRSNQRGCVRVRLVMQTLIGDSLPINNICWGRMDALML